MSRISWLPLLCCLSACNGNNNSDHDVTDHHTADADADTDADTDSDTDTDGDCDLEITSVDPADGVDLVKLDRDVVVEFSGAVTTDVPWSVDVTGATGTATLAGDGLSATWSAATSLPPDTVLTVNAAVCGDTSTSTFETLPPPIDPALVPPGTYLVVWDSVTITEPPLASLVAGGIPFQYVLIELGEIDPVALTVPSAIALGDDTDGSLGPVCLSAVEAESSFDLNPYVSFGPATMDFVVDAGAGTTSSAEDLTIIGRVAQDGSALTDVRLSALVVPEELTELGNCQTLAPLVQGTCKPCSVSSSGKCLLVSGTVPAAAFVPGIDILATCAP